MRYFAVSVGFSLALGIGCSIFMIIFIEGWGIIVTLLATIASFGLAGFFMGQTRPKSAKFAGFLISLPFILGTFPNLEDIQMLSDHSNPSAGFPLYVYTFLPLISLMSAYIGVFIGSRNSKVRDQLIPK
jgi:hypothetical protein